MPAVPLSRWSQQIGGVSVNFTVGRIVPVPRIPARKPGGVPPTSATGQLSTPGDDFASSPFVGATCGGVGPRDCPAAVLSFHHDATNTEGAR